MCFLQRSILTESTWLEWLTIKSIKIFIRDNV